MSEVLIDAICFECDRPVLSHEPSVCVDEEIWHIECFDSRVDEENFDSDFIAD